MNIFRFIARFIILRPFAAAILVGVTALAVYGIMALTNYMKEEPVDPVALLADSPFVADTNTIVPIVFDGAQQAAVYDWALVARSEEEENDPALVETVTFEKNGQSYELVLSTTKEKPTDQEFTQSDYLALTVHATFAQTKATVVYIDLEANGIIDSAYINDTRVMDEQALIDAQRMYAFELGIARDFMLNG